MPVYEFVCHDCSEKFDTLVRSFAAAQSVTCRTCESVNVKRLISTFAVAGMDDPFTMAPSARASGGCCGGSCGCRH